MMLANPTRQMFAQQTTTDMDGTGGIDHHHRQHHPFINTQRPAYPQRKRKAETQPENNERLSKRMSLLNLEQNGAKLYVPVENPGVATATGTNLQQSIPTYSSLRTPPPPPFAHDAIPDDTMQLDDTKYKVYIYNMEDELSSESEAEDNNDNNNNNDGKLVFLPDIEKHLRANRINANNGAGSLLPSYMLGGGSPDPIDLAQKQLVLYNIPRAISVPEEQDSVRKAIIEARARMRERERAEQLEQGRTPRLIGFGGEEVGGVVPAVPPPPPTNGFQSCAPGGGDDPDAMELD